MSTTEKKKYRIVANKKEGVNQCGRLKKGYFFAKGGQLLFSVKPKKTKKTAKRKTTAKRRTVKK